MPICPSVVLAYTFISFYSPLQILDFWMNFCFSKRNEWRNKCVENVWVNALYTNWPNITPTLLLFHAWFPIVLINFAQLSRTFNLIHAPIQLWLGRVSIHTLGQLFPQTSVRPKVGQKHIFFYKQQLQPQVANKSAQNQCAECLINLTKVRWSDFLSKMGLKWSDFSQKSNLFWSRSDFHIVVTASGTRWDFIKMVAVCTIEHNPRYLWIYCECIQHTTNHVQHTATTTTIPAFF